MLARLRRWWRQGSGTRRWMLFAVVAAATVVGVGAVAVTVDRSALLGAWRHVVAQPEVVALTLTAYAAAFVLRAVAWRRLLPGLALGQAVAGLHVSLAANHVLPFRLGEVLRITSVVRRAGITVPAATASTVTLRAADLAAVAVLAGLAGGQAGGRVLGHGMWALAGVATLVLVGVAVWIRRLRARRDAVRNLDVVAAGLTLVSWMLEAVVVFQAARWVGVVLTPAEAVAVTAVTIAAQALAITPGGIGTYEAAATGVLVALGVTPGVALAVAVTAHGLKTAYALVSGGAALFVPAPGFFGRLRLAPRDHRRAPRRTDRPARRDRPVVLFLPAYEEEASVAGVVGRAPARVGAHPVEVIVVDDGSPDRTAERAAGAGAAVVRLGENRGLGAAVRRGLAAALDRDPVAVAFCDADGEYAPEEIGTVVGPILDGAADYVVGSRFRGDIERMLPHRRLGNRALTWLLRAVAREPITDGQSGYRAFSPQAAAAVEIVHDFNYAQVLTLDLLAKGFRYAEVPISYRFREQGESFVRLFTYLRAVLPAIYRQLNRDPVAADGR